MRDPHMNKFPNLFTPLKIGSLEIKNRILMSPCTTDFVTHDGELTDRFVDYYVARAAGGVGLIVLEDTTIGPRYSHNTLRIDDDKLIPAWKKFVSTVHEHGAKIMPQLMHPVYNARAMINEGQQPVAASAIPARMSRELPRELSVEEIEHLVDRMTEDAMRAKAVGCDGVFLHCAHKHHLLGSFLSPLSNKRTDEYGGDIHGRMKLALDVIRSIRAATGPDFPILIRISGDELEPGGRTLLETQYIAPLFVAAGVDAIQLTVGSLEDGAFNTTPPMGTPFGPNRIYSKAIKDVVDVPVICGTRITSPDVAEDILATGKADAVAMGRALIADPAFANKALEGRVDDIIPCWGCLHCLVQTFKSNRGIECSINPTVGIEAAAVLTKTDVPKNILVAGGGPAGLEAARIAAERGHHVTLIDRDSKLGGQLIPASIAPMKQEIVILTKHLVLQAKKAGVKIILNEEVTAETVQRLQPDVVIDATGGVPLVPNVAGLDNPNVVKAWDVLNGLVTTGRNAVVIGGGQTGCEVADFLAHPIQDMTPYGTNVTLLQRAPNIALQELSSFRSTLVQRMLKKGVKIIAGAEALEFSDNAVRYVAGGEEHVITGVDTIVVGTGTKPNLALSEALKARGVEVHMIGDVNGPRQVAEAVREAAELARRI